MSAPRWSAVTYVGLPIGSGGAHSLGAMPLRTAYERATAFLETCVELEQPVRHWFDLPHVPKLPRQPLLKARLRRRFRVGGDLDPERVGEALEFLEAIDPQPANQYGMAPIYFWTSARFRILDPDTGAPIPGQDPSRFAGVEYDVRTVLGVSRLHLSLSNTAALGLSFCLPDADEALLARVVPFLQEHLPCRLSTVQWRTWTPTATGSFRARKLSPPLPWRTP